MKRSARGLSKKGLFPKPVRITNKKGERVFCVERVGI